MAAHQNFEEKRPCKGLLAILVEIYPQKKSGENECSIQSCAFSSRYSMKITPIIFSAKQFFVIFVHKNVKF
jgi:hypothetical protein